MVTGKLLWRWRCQPDNPPDDEGRSPCSHHRGRHGSLPVETEGHITTRLDWDREVGEGCGTNHSLGWGVDMVFGRANCISSDQRDGLTGERWSPAISTTTTTALRTPVSGSLAALRERYHSFLHRIGETGFAPVEPLTRFEVIGYRRLSDPLMRPHAVFELRHDDGSFCRCPQRKLVHIAGMIRHLAKEAMIQSPPTDANDHWIERYVAGHRDEAADEHRQFSYLPLPSIGHEYADQAVRGS